MKAKISYTDKNAVKLLSKTLRKLVSQKEQIVIVCIGTDRSTGDSLGPLVGSTLKKKLKNIPVYGTLDDPVHAMNLKETLERIDKNAFVIAIDACLGQLSSVGSIVIENKSIKPGAGVHKDLPEVGNVSITGIVNVGGFMEYLVLQNTRLSIVMNMANAIAKVVIASCRIRTISSIQEVAATN